jgi:hypothetical protein
MYNLTHVFPREQTWVLIRPSVRNSILDQATINLKTLTEGGNSKVLVTFGLANMAQLGKLQAEPKCAEESAST